MTNKLIKIVDNLVEMRESIVPIIGEDVFYVSDAVGHRQSIQAYLTDCFLNEYDDVEVSAPSIELMKNGGYYGLSKIAKTFREDFVADYRSYIKRAKINGWLKIDETVFRFLQTYKFPLIITTSCFDILESVLNESNLQYGSISYRIEGDNERPVSPSNHSIYHIFGLVADGSQWVYDEDQMLEFMHALHDKDTTSKNLKKYLDAKNARLLVLGCNLPDWLFRFLWYTIKSSRSSSLSTKQGYWLSANECDESFTDFLANIKFFSATEVREILNYATEKMETVRDEECASDDGEHFDAFLSYASEDRLIANRIYELLSLKGYRVWFDKRGHGKIAPGSNYMRRIVRGIEHSSRYVPIITENFIRKICNPDSNLKLETDIVRKHVKNQGIDGDGYSLPIIIDGQTYNDENVIDSAFVEGLTRYVLPKELFYRINMYTFNADRDKDIDIKL